VRGLRAGPPGGGQRLRFDVEPGQIVAIAGPTGSGKTTLLRALLGLELTDEGTIRYGSEDLSRREVGPSARPFAWVPQEAAIVTGTIADNVALGRRGALAASTEAVARQSLAAIGAAPLVQRVHERVSAGGPELSGGERQWIAIARALASELPVLLLDEPTAGLDDEAQRQVLDALAALRGQRTIIVVSHRAEPLQLADQVIELAREPAKGAAAFA
jgi:ABC-type bacteriocin/lantibiotic exporter with double-glycine peptidase domain